MDQTTSRPDTRRWLERKRAKEKSEHIPGWVWWLIAVGLTTAVIIATGKLGAALVGLVLVCGVVNHFHKASKAVRRIPS